MTESSRASWISLLVPGLLGLWLLASTGFDLLPALGVYDGKRLLQGFTLILLFLLPLLDGRLRIEIGRQWARIPVWMVAAVLTAFGLATLSASRTIWLGYALADLALLFSLPLAVLIIAASRVTAGVLFDRLAMGVLAALVVIVALQESMGLLVGWLGHREFSFDQMLVRFAHPRFYNQLQSWSLLTLAALPLVFPNSPRIRWMTVVLLGLQWCLLLMSGGRGSFLSLVISLLLLTVLVRARRPLWLRWHVLGLLLGFIFYALILTGHSQQAPKGGAFVEQSLGRNMVHSTGRVQLWALAWDITRENPWLGGGPQHFDCEGKAITPAHPHSFPMRLLSEWGIPAALLIFAVVLVLGWRLLRLLRHQPDDDPSAITALVAAGLIAAAIHAGLSGILTMPASQIMAIFISGWLLGRIQVAPELNHTRSFAAIYICVCGLALAIGISAFNVAELKQMKHRVSALKMMGPAQPRYWQHGRVCLFEPNRVEKQTIE